MDENPTHPRGHCVRLRGPKVHIEDNNRHAYTERVEDHCEQDELAKKGNDQGGWRNDFSKKQKEDSKGEENGDG